jgi:hypothetical protein
MWVDWGQRLAHGLELLCEGLVEVLSVAHGTEDHMVMHIPDDIVQGQGVHAVVLQYS